MAVTVESIPPLIATNILPLLVMISGAKVGKKEEDEAEAEAKAKAEAEAEAKVG